MFLLSMNLSLFQNFHNNSNIVCRKCEFRLMLAIIVTRFLTGWTLYIKCSLNSLEISHILFQTFCVSHPQCSCLISYCLRTNNLFLVKMLQHESGLSTVYVHFRTLQCRKLSASVEKAQCEKRNFLFPHHSAKYAFEL